MLISWRLVSWRLVTWRFKSWRFKSWRLKSWRLVSWRLISWRLISWRLISLRLKSWRLKSWRLISWRLISWRFRSLRLNPGLTYKLQMSQILSIRKWLQILSLQRYQIKTKITANVTIPAMTPPIDNPPPWWSSLWSSGKWSGSGKWPESGNWSGSGKGSQGLPGLPETKRDTLIIRSIFNIVTRVQLKLLFSKTSLHKLVLNFRTFFLNYFIEI